jgi:hypothetical protein
MAVKTFQRCGKSAGFFCLTISALLTCPRGDGDLDNEENRDGRSGYDLGVGLTGCDGGIDERPCEEFFYVSLSPPFSGKTEVTRELDKACQSTFSNADWPRPVGTAVRWERTMHREGRAATFILHS